MRNPSSVEGNIADTGLSRMTGCDIFLAINYEVWYLWRQRKLLEMLYFMLEYIWRVVLVYWRLLHDEITYS